MCIGCRGRAAKSELVRVLAVENACVLDPTGHLAGRGAYLHNDQRCLDLATRRRAFPRALRHEGPLALDAVAEFLTAARASSTAISTTAKKHQRPPQQDSSTEESSAQPRVREREQVESNERSMSTKR
jgi:predicted RNA-binding protein YlxR (DUF448 family)